VRWSEVRGIRTLPWRAFVAGVILQVFFIGLGLFVGPENLALHVNFGWLLHLAPLPVLVAAAFARAGRTQIMQSAALAVLVFFVPILAAVRTDLPFVAAFHPVGAVLGFWLATAVARGATALAGTADTGAPTTRWQWLLVALVVVILLVLGLPSPD
jgi:hypothetical protein